LLELREKLLVWKEQLLPKHPMFNLPTMQPSELSAWLPDQWKLNQSASTNGREASP
jgi:hypothetical protein